MRKTLLLLLGLMSCCVRANDSYIPDKAEKVTVQCTCVFSKPGCHKKVFDEISGAERHQWSQKNYFTVATVGKALNLDAACHRKRDEQGKGDSLCCEIPGNHKMSIKNLFRGEVQGR